ncbi:uncharacterized protein Rexo5 isoform X1 [Procambarus clarkii]|uniref:uncharacterized protein Rexo5 isoform X1 n=1 Tax=Procambarus clarkii TaxID=6728 RepID=UPI001E673489|nr:uncharacterized protein LOC123745299 [Procambarus clarkii]
METKSTRKIERLENKKRKMKAYLAIAESNKEDRDKKMKDNSHQTGSNHATQIQLIAKRNAEEPIEVPQPSKRRLTDTEYAEMKQRKKKLDAEKMAWPRAFLNDTGERSSLNLSADKRFPLFMSDVRSFLMFSLLHNRSPDTPRWIKVIRTRKFSHVITAVIEGVSISDLVNEVDSSEIHKVGNSEEKATSDNFITEKSQKKSDTMDSDACNKREDEIDTNIDCPEDETSKGSEDLPKSLSKALPRTSSLMHHCLELLAPSRYNVGPFEELLNIPLSRRLKDKVVSGFKTLEGAEENKLINRSIVSMFPVACSKDVFKEIMKTNKTSLIHEDGKVVKSSHTDKFDRRSLLLSVEDMIEHGFPSPVPDCPGYGDPEFKFTRKVYSEVTATSPMFGVDCEMCLTTARKLELTSISVVNEDMELIYHKLVKPKNPIINYLTQFSGITKSMLNNVYTRVKDVQQDLEELLPADAILVGHSLDSDLKAMKVMHPYVIDSSLVYNLSHIRKKRSSLKLLTKLFLGKDIQGSKHGHDPTEDAGASLKLVQLKLKNDVTFGDVIHGGKVPDSPHNLERDTENLVEDYVNRIETECMTQQRYVTSLFQYADNLSMAMLATPSTMENYEDVLSFMGKKVSHIEVVPDNKQLSVRTAEICLFKDLTYVHMKMDTKLDKCSTPESRQHQFKKLDKRLQRIYRSAAAKALIVYIFTGSSLDVPADQRSNGLIMFSIKELPFIR